MDYYDFVDEFYIESYFDLFRLIKGSFNFKSDYIFRGMGNADYKLIPMALRMDKFENPVINNYIDSDFQVSCSKSINELFGNLKISFEDYTKIKEGASAKMRFNKYGGINYDFNEYFRPISPIWQLQIKRELHILDKFLKLVNKSGLDISNDNYIKKLIQDDLQNPLDEWPNDNFFEIMALAQHYNLPTQALGWSYDYRVALYFAVRNILENDDNDGVVWAFNYKLFENNENCKLHFHNPKYYLHQDLKAQSTLFTFIVNNDFNFDQRPFDEIIVEDYIDDLNGVELNNENLFYKFIIPNEYKHEILNDLYIDGYSEEVLFPGYGGVTLAIKNHVKLNDYVNQLNAPFKKSILMSFSDNEIKKIIHNNKRVIFNQVPITPSIIRIFIYSKESKSVVGYFDDCKVFKNTFENIWNEFKSDSLMSEWKFKSIFKNEDYVFAIKLTDLKLFEYPIKLDCFEFQQDYYEVSNLTSTRFLLNFV